MFNKIALALMCVTLALLPASAQSVFNCSSFSSSGACGVHITIGSGSGGSGNFALVGSNNGANPSLSGGNLIMGPAGVTHWALNLNYQSVVDVRAFNTTFTFIPDGQNLAIVMQNCKGTAQGKPANGAGTCGGFALQNFSAGASGEGSFYQGFSGNPWPYNVFALMFDQYSYLNNSDSSFTYSNVQIFQQNQQPALPTGGNCSGQSQPCWGTSKVSTSPVALNSPSNTQNTSTGHVYSANLVYDGSTLTLNLFDVTGGGSCPGASCFTKTWSNVSIPSQVGGTTAYVGLAASTGLSAPTNLQINSWSYTVNTATASPGSTVTSAGSVTASNPTLSPAPGSYSGTQNVTVSCSGTDTYACYATGASGLTLTPITNNYGNCGEGSLYASPVPVSSTTTFYAVCGINNTLPSVSACNGGTCGLSSGVVQGTYTISALPTLTLKATHETMEQGQPVPPLIWSFSTPSAAASCTGEPSITTAATSASTPGNYTTTISAGSLSCSGYTLAFTNGTMAVIAADGNGPQINNSVVYPAGFTSGATNPVINVTTAGVCPGSTPDHMVGDDSTLNDSCLTYLNDRYLSTDCAHQPSNINYLYFPTGTYLFSQQVSPCGNGWTYWGDGPGKTIFHLQNNSAAFNTGTNTQFFNPSSVSSASNFREYIYNIGIHIGYGNPNAIPMTSVMNNSGALRNVQIWAEDSNCPYGLSLARAYAGPALAKNIGIYGCAEAIFSNQAEYNFVFDQVTFQGQTGTAAIDITGYNITMQHVLTDDTIPFYLARSIGTASSLAILDSELLNGASGNIAIDQTNTSGIVYERNVTTTGYGTAISDANGSTQTTMPAEYWSASPLCVFCSAPGSLHLPEQETPLPTDDPTVSNWMNLGSNGANFASELASPTSVTAYVPPGTISGTGTYAITVPDTVNHILFYNSLTASQNPKFTLTVAGTSSTPLVIDNCAYAVCNIIHTGSRTVVVNDSYLNGYAPSSGAGNFFAEDIVTNGGSNTTTTELWPSQNFWGRQINMENKTIPAGQYLCNGATMWMLGYKTENNATLSGGNPSVVESNHCKAEIFGHFYYPLVATGTGVQGSLTNSSLADIGVTFVPGANQGWPNLYTSTQATTGTTPAVSQSTTQRTSLFYDYGATATTGPPWTGILAPARADANWQLAGAAIPSGSIPNCTTQPASNTPAAITAAFTADAGGSSYCMLNIPSGTVNVSGTIVLQYAGVANVVVNGAGSNSTIYNWTGGTSSNCNGLSGTNLCVWSGDSSSPTAGGWANHAAISSGLTQGSNTIVLANDTNLKVGSIIQLAQKDPSSDNGNAYPCSNTSASTPCSQQGGTSQSAVGGVSASITQMSTVVGCGTTTYGAACTSTTITLNDKIKLTNWNSSFSPTAQWPNTLPISNVVVQNMALNVASVTAHIIVECHMCYNVAFNALATVNGLVTGQAATNHYILWGDSHTTVEHGYMYGSNPASEGYGIDWDAGTSDSLGLNMISQKIATAYINETGVGNVYGYNYSVDNYYGSNFQQCDEFLHSAGDILNLFEGNIGICGGGDDIHGSHFFNTWFRNRLLGWDPATDGGGPRTSNVYTFSDMAYSRGNNLVGNILGTTGKNTTYQLLGNPSSTTCSGAGNNNLYQFNFGDQNNRFYSSSACGDSPTGTINNDSLVHGMVMRWLNWDVVTNATRACTSSAPPPCTEDETASSAPAYPGLASPSTTLPASFIFSSTPSWWQFPSGTASPFPGIGPDVTGGNMSGAGGHANLNPAANCYLNVLGGAVDGSSGPLPFDSNNCYSGGVVPPTCGTPTQGTNVSGTYNCSGSTCTPAGGGASVAYPLNVQFNAVDSCSLFYATGGATANCSSAAYPSGGFNITATTQYSVAACQSGYTPSPTAGGLWTINVTEPTAATPAFSPGTGTYAYNTPVTMSTTTGCAAYIYWSGVNDPPTTADYNASAFYVRNSLTVYAKVIGCPGYSDSAVGSATFTLSTVPAAPVLQLLAEYNLFNEWSSK